MDELAKEISSKLGISEDAARKAILVTTQYLKAKLPPPVSRDIELALDMKNVTEEEIAFVGLFKMP